MLIIFYDLLFHFRISLNKNIKKAIMKEKTSVTNLTSVPEADFLGVVAESKKLRLFSRFVVI